MFRTNSLEKLIRKCSRKKWPVFQKRRETTIFSGRKLKDSLKILQNPLNCSRFVSIFQFVTLFNSRVLALAITLNSASTKFRNDIIEVLKVTFRLNIS